MRLPILLPLAFLVAACQSAPDDAAPEAAPAAVPAPPPGPSLTVRIDSLLLDRPELSYRVAIGYPQLRGSSGEPMSAALRAVNAAVRDSVEALAADFRPEAPPAGAGPPEYPVSVDGATPRRYLSDDVFSALVEVYAYTGGAHGTTFFLPLTFDLRSGRALSPADLFAPGTPWADTLAAHVGRGARARIADGSGSAAPGAFYPEGLDALRAGRVDLTLGADSVTVHVPPYQLSAYASGSFHVAVPRSALAAFAREGGVLDRR